ncbi:MAG: DUF839 domain-containing protein [Woeseiaceae bacterium]|nr:DUF839 domain-containing protein [Woeseiaceae bacterium]
MSIGKNMLNRRHFLQSIAAAAAGPVAGVSSCAAAPRAFGPLLPDPAHILDVPADFSVSVVSRAGARMSDGFRVPPAHDGMAAFSGDDGRIILICNHEMASSFPEYSAFGTDFDALDNATKEKVYDWGGGVTPGAGGTTTTVYDPAKRTTERQFLSLAGTELNCAGGPTPWRSWLSCEETFGSPGTSYLLGRKLVREERHGYVFEVAADAEGLVEPVPLRAMGRFEHEAVAVHESSGVVYLTEDHHHSLFYRFLPNVPGKLREGGKLQALSIEGRPSLATHNWGARPNFKIGASLRTRWLDLDNVDPVEDDLRLRGAENGAAMFARGEGLTVAGDDIVFTCTIGGRARLGQVFRYRPSPFEGTGKEQQSPGRLILLAESDARSLLRNADNLTMAPWGDLIICEDTLEHCGLVGMRPDGTQYALADNPHSASELAGVCFSPDGKTLFVNIQYPGMTVAITGPWPTV